MPADFHEPMTMLNFYIQDEVLAWIDESANKAHQKRSQWLRDLLLNAMNKEKPRMVNKEIASHGAALNKWLYGSIV